MKFLLYIVVGISALILVLYLIYFCLLIKLKKINKKIYKSKVEEVIRKTNILIIYQPSRHKTTFKISELIKKVAYDKGYGYKIQTLSKENTHYDKYEKVVFIAPVYFGSIHDEFLVKLSEDKIKNLIIVYNGINLDDVSEDNEVGKIIKNRYNKIKLHTNDIEKVNQFLERII